MGFRTLARSLALVGLGSLAMAANAATAPVTQVLPATSGPITFANTAVGGGTSTQTVSLQLNVNGTITITAPASANGHQEFSVGSITGCSANGTTTNASGSVCTFTVTFSPYYPGQRSIPLVVTLNGQVYSFGMTGLATGPQAHPDTTALTTITGTSGVTSSTPYTYKTGVPLGSTGILYEPEGIATGSDNNLYITDSGHNLVRLGYQTANAQVACLIIEENPTDFGLAATANSCAGATSQPTVGDLYTIAGTTTATFNGDNQLATSANVSPAGVEVDAAGNVFIGDIGNNRIRLIYQGGANIACLIEIENPTLFGLAAGSTTCTAATSTPTPGFIYTIAGTGTAGYSGDGGLATAANLYNPNDTAVDAAGDVFLMDFYGGATAPANEGGRIRVIYNGGALAAQLITVENPSVTVPVVGDIYTVMGSGTANVEGGDGGLATSAGALTIYGLRIDAYDNIYFSDKTYGSTSAGSATNTSRVRVVYNGTALTSNPLAAFIALENPSLGGAANVKPGYVYTVGGENGTATASAQVSDGVLATAQQFAGVYGIVLDPANDIIVADRLNYTIRRISFATGLINTIAGYPTTTQGILTGSAQYNSTGAVVTGVGQLWGPWPISIDSSGGFYFSDEGANRVRNLASASSSSYPLLLASTNVGSVSPIQYFWMTNTGTPGSTLTITADNAAAPFGFESPANAPGITECHATSTTTPQTSSITTPVSLASGTSCAFGLAAAPTNGGTTVGTITTTDNSLNIANYSHSYYASVSAIGVTTVLTWSPTPAVAGQPETLTATLTTSAAAPVTSGTVTFYITGQTTPLGSAMLSSTGTASITTSALVSPSTSITTVYPGATSVNPAFTSSTSVTVIPVSLTVVTLTVNNTTPNLGQSITLTATVSSPVSAGAFTGTMTFYDGSSTIIGTSSTNTNGVFTFSTSTLAAGVHTLKAVYSGDPNYVNATSNTVSVTVTAPAYTPTLTTPAGIAILTGQSATVGYSITAVGGYTGTVTVSCGPATTTQVTCTNFSPYTFVFTGTNTTVTGTVTITAITVASNEMPASNILFAGFMIPGTLLSACLAFFTLRRRKTLRAWQTLALIVVCTLPLIGLGGCSSNTNFSPKITVNVPLTFNDGTTSFVLPVTVTVTGSSDAN